tara:strand:+ start:2604 stop:3284 length:681 start_codon:yes stop_codon:yes gene_type:complete
MNKLAILALSLLLFFGGTLWYLANSELNVNIQARIVQVGEYYTEQKVDIDKVKIDLKKGVGEIYGLKLYNPSEYQEKYTLTIERLIFKFDPKSLNAKVININGIELNGSKFYIESMSNNNKIKVTNFEELYQLLNSKIALIRDRKRQKSEVFINSEEITLMNSQIVSLVDTSLNKSITENSTKMVLKPVGGETGLPASLFGIEVLRKILEESANLDLKKNNEKISD